MIHNDRSQTSTASIPSRFRRSARFLTARQDAYTLAGGILVSRLVGEGVDAIPVFIEHSAIGASDNDTPLMQSINQERLTLVKCGGHEACILVSANKLPLFSTRRRRGAYEIGDAGL